MLAEALAIGGGGLATLLVAGLVFGFWLPRLWRSRKT